MHIAKICPRSCGNERSAIIVVIIEISVPPPAPFSDRRQQENATYCWLAITVTWPKYKQLIPKGNKQTTTKAIASLDQQIP